LTISQFDNFSISHFDNFSVSHFVYLCTLKINTTHFSDFKMDNQLTSISTAIAASVLAGQEILKSNFARGEC